MSEYKKYVERFNNIEVVEYQYSPDEETSIHPIWFEQEFNNRMRYCHYYKSGWGNEYRYVKEELGTYFELISLSGRCSSVFHPFIVLEDTEGVLYSYSLMYSGNWKLSYKCSHGINKLVIEYDDSFSTKVKVGEIFTSPKVAYQKGTDWNTIRIQWQKFSDSLMKTNELQRQIPVAWNHWWAYEDKLINEYKFIKNAEIASKIGVDICVLDAGWFGEEAHWFDVRGDWSLVNKDKFPSGIKRISDKVHELGMKFGFWMEIEGLGQKAKLNEIHPSFAAKREDKSLGYVCFGNEEVVQWALNTLGEVIENYNCDWIKFDFNLDPGLGCDCEEHNHGKFDGLDAHYRGLYRFFDLLNKKYPDVVFENCSSGGQRTDLKLLSFMHVNFLSDPDYPYHKMRCIKNASEMLAANRIFHFIPSQTQGDDTSRPFHNSDLSKVSMEELRYYTRIGMLTAMGISHRLEEYPLEIIEKLSYEIDIYKKYIRDYLKGSEYIIIEKENGIINSYSKNDKHLLMVFGKGDIEINKVELSLDSDSSYEIFDVDSKDITKWEHMKYIVSMKNEKVRTLLIKTL